VDPREFGDGVAELAEKIEGVGLQLVARDLTHDLRVPTALAVIVDQAVAHSGIAARSSMDHALTAAILEAAQSRATDLQGAREDLVHERLECHPWFRDTHAPRRDPLGGSLQVSSAGQMNALLLRRLAAAELGCPLFVDLSDERIPLCVVRVICPGLEQWALVPERAQRRVREWLGR